MPNPTSKTTSRKDFVILEYYEDPDENKINGEFPIYVSGVSECCKDNNGYIEVIPVIIPQTQ
jgi:hypothetical protein